MKKSRSAKDVGKNVDHQRLKSLLDLLGTPRTKAELEEQTRILTALLKGSRYLADLLAAHPDWISTIEVGRIRHPRHEKGLRTEVEAWLKPGLEQRDYAGSLFKLREFRQREMLRIATRDLARLSNVVEITGEISDVADVCLDAVWRICREQFFARFGQPYHEDVEGRWQPTAFCVLGMGKLGGRELNYSSDVDLLFAYDDEGQVFKDQPTEKKVSKATMSSHQFFNRLAEVFIAEVGRVTSEGMLFRVDMRLRPEGDAGPLCRSLAGYENYYAQWGQTWERMMLMKGRGVAGDIALAGEFLEMIQPFRYPQFVNENVFREVAAIKKRIENEIVGAEDLERNVKLGRGGIREIEFVAQALQLLHAGRKPFLQSSQTLPSLSKLTDYGLLGVEEAAQLSKAYCFLRDVEHRLQMEANAQTHTIPADTAARERLAGLMGFDSVEAFDTAFDGHKENVRRAYDRVLQLEGVEEKSSLPGKFDGAEAAWKKTLEEHSFRDADAAIRLLKEFSEGPGYVNVSQRTTELALELIPKLLALCPVNGKVVDGKSQVLSDPDRVLSRLDSFIVAYGARASLLELWNSNLQLFELLLLLFDRSEFLAEAAIRTPDLVDELVISGRLRQQKTTEQILKDLRYGADDEDQFEWLRRYHEVERMRLGLRDILGLVDFEENFAELSALADACLQYALEVVMRQNKIKKPPFAIIGLGKLGGCEINYGSDLDIMFVTGSKAKDLPKLQKLGREVMELLSRRTEQGIVFQTDARLRPDGEKGLLVNSLDAFEEYYRQRAQLWEIQSLTRVRPVAGDLELGQQFRRMAARVTNFKAMQRVGDDVRSFILKKQKAENRKRKAAKTPYVVSYTSDWERKIHEMRMRIEKERTPAGQDDLAIKTGKGGLMDAEFIAQTLCLEHGWTEANSLRVLESARDAGFLPNADKLLENYRHLRRVEGILRRWSYEGETVLPDDPAPYYRVSVRCGFATPEEFRTALAKWRASIRKAFLKFFTGS